MMLNPDAIPLGGSATEAAPDPNAALRFEDLTIDDDLSLLDRVVRYVRSGIALQRLVHVKMIAETAKAVGTESTMNSLLPLLPPLVSDSESIIRQHLAMQLLPLCLTCMFGDDPNFDPKARLSDHRTPPIYNDGGYAIATVKLVSYMNTLLSDPDIDVRKAASDALATLALYIRSKDIPSVILRIPLRLVQDDKVRKTPKQTDKSSESFSDDLCITACHLLADVASVSPEQVTPFMVSKHISPTIRNLCKHDNFRVRRAAVQALPRVISGSTLDDVTSTLIPAFVQLGMDESYRVRKSVGECLVDVSRSLMLLTKGKHTLTTIDDEASNSGDHDNRKTGEMSKRELKIAMRRLRRDSLTPICTKLLQDNHKAVKYGMLQFLGPFIASFYPLDDGDDEVDGDDNDGIIGILDGNKDNEVGGMGSQFFPHANGMVTRLNPESVSSPVTMPGIIQAQVQEKTFSPNSKEYLESLLPEFLEKRHNDAKSLVSILRHREKTKIDQDDIAMIESKLLPSYVELANINTGDENSDAEMRVYCAYSLPAVVLLLGSDGWEKSLKTCFLKLLIGSNDTLRNKDTAASASIVPLAVKRCLASSFHTTCNILGQQAFQATAEEKNNKRDLLSMFEYSFLRDQDDTVRLNIIRNLPSFLSLLSFSKRSKYLPMLFDIICGDTMLASKRKNSLNPILLNWRQRDMIAQILPNLIVLYRPDQVRQYLWPIVKLLLSDSVNLIRENVEWSIPILLRSYEYNSCLLGREDTNAVKIFCQESCNEVFIFLKATLLENKPTSNRTATCGAFSKRQSYCRILSAMALILRLNEDRGMKRTKNDESKENKPYPIHPYYDLTREAYRHLHHLLRTLFLPPALLMKDDKVTNVRLTLAKSLRVMPADISDRGDVHVILRTLEDEIETWEGGGGQNMQVESPKIKTDDASVNNATNLVAAPKTGTDLKIEGSKDMQVDSQDDKKAPKVGANEDDSMSLASI